MSEARLRYFVVSPDGETCVGYERRDIAKGAALEYGEGAHIVDTEARPYEPMVMRIEGREPVYLEHGAWDTRGSADDNLIEAVRHGYAPIVRAYLAKGAQVDARDERNGGTALIWAAAGKSPEVVRLLLDMGADVDARDRGGMTALAIARRKERAENIALLEAAGAEEADE